jgi:cysteine-rich repeat protein
MPDAATLAKCGDGHVDPGEQCDDGNTIPNDGCTLCMNDAERMAAIDATWLLTTVAGDTAPCPSGFDTAAVIATPTDGNGNPTGAPLVSLLDCSAGMGTSDKLPATTYSAQVAITDHAMSQTFATSDPQPVDLSDATDKPLDTTFLMDGGRFKLAWKLVKMSDGTAVTCADVGVTPRVKVLITPDGGMGSSSTFSCSANMAVTAPFVAGSFMVTVSILNDTFMNAGAAPTLTGQTIVAPNGVTDLATVTIPIAAL